MNYGTKYDKLWCALVTPYKANTFEIDESALRGLLGYFLKSPGFVKRGGIIVNPAAGEMFSLSREELRRNVQIVVEECRGKLPVFAGAAGSTTQQAIEEALDAKKLGAEGLFMHPPIGSGDIAGNWNATMYPEMLIDYSKAIDEAADLPIIFSPSGGGGWKHGNFPPNVVADLVKQIPNIVGWKMTYSDEGYRIIARTLRSSGRHVAVLPAAGNKFHGAIFDEMFDGTLSGCWNYAMEPMLSHIEAWDRGDIAEAKRIWRAGLEELHAYTSSDGNRHHIRYKAACWMRGLIPNPLMRPPYPKLRPEEVVQLRTLLMKTGLNVIDQSQLEREYDLYVYNPEKKLMPKITA